MHEDEATLIVNWWFKRLMTLLAGLLAISVTGNVYQATRPKPPSPVFPVNQWGEPVGMILPVTSMQAIPDPIIRGWLANFIHDAFTISPSADQEKYLLDSTAARVTGQARQALNDWYSRDKNKHHPAIVYYKEWQEAPVTRTIKLPAPFTYEADFTTVTHEYNDKTQTIRHWRAIAHLTTGQSEDPESNDIFADSLDFEPDVHDGAAS
jgi:type IV secretory pathway TrbF-like protein